MSGWTRALKWPLVLNLILGKALLEGIAKLSHKPQLLLNARRPLTLP